jgi:hypothetical protein
MDRQLRLLRNGRNWWKGCFELDRWPVGQCRVESAAIVDVFDKAADRLASMPHIPVGSAVNLLLLECS